MNWFQRLLRSKQMERELHAELSFHIESQIANKVRTGVPEAEARRSTRLEFGGLDRIKEDCRENRGTLWLASILQDLRFGARILRRSPGFSSTAILVLALGIGVCTFAFSLYNLIVLQSIPVRDPKTIVRVERRSPGNIEPGVPYASIAYYRDNAKSLTAVMETMSTAPMVLNHQDARIRPGFVSANFFTELGASASIGRLFTPEHDEPSGAPPVAVLSFQCWQRNFAGQPSVLGKTIYLDGRPVTVIGVTSSRFANLGTENPDLWLPLQQHSYFFAGSKPLDDPKFDGMIAMWGRLAAGINPSQAEQELLALTNQLRKMYPTVIWDNERIVVTPGAHFFPLQDGPPVVALVSLLVLLILTVACANLGGLLMARGVGRQREIQLRLHLGARKSRVFRQLLTESLLLGVLGSIAALPLVYIVLCIALNRAGAPVWMSAFPDWRVLMFTTAMGFLAAIVFGMLPTLQIVQGTANRSLWHQLVVCVQVGASCVLLILAGLLVRATLHTIYSDPGFGFEQVLSLDLGLRDHGFTPGTAQTYLDQLQGRVRNVPGVISVSTAFSPPLVNESVNITSIDVDSHRVLIYPNWVGPDFFQTLGIPLLRGRYFNPDDTDAVILSESLAHKRWPHEDPIGKRWKDGKTMVVGVVGNTRAMELNNTDATEIYYPVTPEYLPSMFVLVRTAGAPDSFLPTIKAIAGSANPRLFPTVTLLKTGFHQNVTQVEEIATIIGLLGFVAIFLAVVGLLGLVTYAVSQRTKEIAIRLALGANRAEILSSVLGRFTWPVLSGLVIGIALTSMLSQIIRRGLYGISGLDPIAYLSAITLLLVVLATAAALPVRKAFRLQIARILHTE